MALLARRNRASYFIGSGLLALAIVDRRADLKRVLALLDRLLQSAIALAVDPARLFDEAGSVARPEMALLFERFSRRGADGRIL
jgi:hypothetical protein